MQISKFYLIVLYAFYLILSACSSNSGIAEGRRLLASADSLYMEGEYSAAVEPTMKALELARNAEDNYLQGQAEDMLADVIAATYGGREVVKHRQKAAECYLRADSVRAHRYALIDVGIAYANIDSLRRATVLIDSLLKIGSQDSVLITNCHRATMRMGWHSTGISIWHELKKCRKFYTPTATDYACLALNEVGMMNTVNNIKKKYPDDYEDYIPVVMDYRLYLDSARAIVRTEPERRFVDRITADCYKNAGETELWKSFTDSLREKRLFEQSATTPEAVAGAQRDFESDRATGQQERASTLHTTLIVISLLFMMIAAAGLVYYRLRMKVKNAEIDAQMESLSNLSKEIALGHETDSGLSARIESLFRERWQTINFLCNEFFEKGDSEKTRAFIINEVEKEIQRLKTPRNLRQIEASVNDCMDLIVSRLREQCGEVLKEDDILFITLIYAGFSPRAVCMFTGIKLKSFYTKRTRLVARISASDAPDRDDFLKRLNVSM